MKKYISYTYEPTHDGGVRLIEAIDTGSTIESKTLVYLLPGEEADEFLEHVEELYMMYGDEADEYIEDAVQDYIFG